MLGQEDEQHDLGQASQYTQILRVNSQCPFWKCDTNSPLLLAQSILRILRNPVVKTITIDLTIKSSFSPLLSSNTFQNSQNTSVSPNKN